MMSDRRAEASELEASWEAMEEREGWGRSRRSRRAMKGREGWERSRKGRRAIIQAGSSR